MDSKTMITKETKNKIRVDYEGKLSLKETSAINLNMDQINRNLSDGKMSETKVIDGAEFTLILRASE
jgi:hypothetical protein